MEQPIFNNRELATIIWFSMFFGFVFLNKSTRSAFYGILQALYAKPFYLVLILMVSYITLIVLFLANLGIWELSQLKNTIIWAAFVAWVMLFNLNKIAVDEHYFKSAVLDNLKIVVILEYLINLYVFPFFVEFIFFLPVVAVLVGMVAVAESRPEFNVVKNLLNIVLSILLLFLLIYAVYHVASDLNNFISKSNFTNFVLPILLTILYLPFIYLAALYSRYEQLFIRLGFFIKDPEVLGYAKSKTWLSINFRLNLLNKWSNHLLNYSLETTDQVLFAINDVKKKKS